MSEEKLKDVVENVLRENWKTRDSDTLLVLHVLRELGVRIYINYEDLEKMPALSTILRLRRHIQNDLKMYQASKEVQEHRDRKEVENREKWKNSQFY